MTQKVLKIQVEITYRIPSDNFEDVVSGELSFFKEMEEGFKKWANNPDEIREPVSFEVRHSVEDYIKNENDEEL